MPLFCATSGLAEAKPSATQISLNADCFIPLSLCLLRVDWLPHRELIRWIYHTINIARVIMDISAQGTKGLRRGAPLPVVRYIPPAPSRRVTITLYTPIVLERSV